MYEEPQGSNWITGILIGGFLTLIFFIIFGQKLINLIVKL